MKNKTKTKRLTMLALFEQRHFKSLIVAFGLCLFSSFSVLNAQTVSGTLTGDDGAPLIGVNVLVKGTTLGTITVSYTHLTLPTKRIV